jgi:hypothetical protein
MTQTSLWHEVSDKEKEEIRIDAKQLLEKFGAKLTKIKAPEGHFKNGSGMREDGDGWKTDQEFRDLMLLNAPFVEEDFIVAEKGGWK